SLSITKGYLELPEGVKYHLETGDYYGTDVKLGSDFRIKSHSIQECAAISNNWTELLHYLRKNDYFKISYMGGVSININEKAQITICKHFWDAYKAITG